MTIQTIQSFHCDRCGAEETFKIEDGWGAPKDPALHPEYLRRMNWETVSIETYPKMYEENGRWYAERVGYDMTACPDCVQQLLGTESFRKLKPGEGEDF